MSQLPLYLSAPHPCGYLPGLVARSAFIDPRTPLGPGQRQALVHMGFRRSGPAYYRPACENCHACQSVRVDVAQFRPNRRQRRCWRRNQDLQASWQPAEDSDERFALYQKYLVERHPDGEMDPDDRYGFAEFLCADHFGQTRHLCLRNERQQLLAVLVADRLPMGWSAVYCFYDPAVEARSLGRYAVLHLLAQSARDRLPWVYLGYWIRDCRKMNYKQEYLPQERFSGGQWRRQERPTN